MGALPDYQIEHMEKNRKYLNLKVSFYSGSIGIFRDFFFKISKRFNKMSILKMSILERNGGISFEKKFSHLMDEKLLDFSKVKYSSF